MLKVLIFGAGVVGSVYGCYMAKSGNEVTLLTRPRYAEIINQEGVWLKNLITGIEENIKVKAVSEIREDVNFDFILLTVRSEQLPVAAKELANIVKSNKDTWVILFQNTLKGHEILVKEIDRERIAMGFGAVGGVRKNNLISYYIAKDEKTVIGELNGKKSKRIEQVKGLLESAGFSTKVSSNIKGDVCTHTVLVLPMALIHLCRKDQSLMFGDGPSDIDIAVKGMREGIRLMRKAEIPMAYEAKIMFRIPNCILKKLLHWKLIQGIPQEVREVIWNHAVEEEWFSILETLKTEAEEIGFELEVLTSICDHT